MEYIATRGEMQQIDAYSIEKLGIPGLVLMEKAAMAMEEEILARFPEKASVLVTVERGNNGGDGLALARLLAHRGYAVDIYEIGGVAHASDSYITQKNIVQALGLPLYEQLPDKQYDIMVDAVFGVGLKREVTGVQKDALAQMNQMRGYKIAVDVPSGVDASTGQIMGIAFRADLTVTFGLGKAGLLLYPGAAYAGEVAVKDIGFPEQAVRQVSPRCFTYTKEDLSLLPPRKAWSNKGTYGKVLLIAGSRNMAGAAYLSARAAYRAGAGLVRIFTCEDNRIILQSKLPDAILTTYMGKEDICEKLESAMEWADVIGFGPGLGVNTVTVTLLEEVLTRGRVPLILDADGLNTLAKLRSHPGERFAPIIEAYENYEPGIALTPHLKEMSRLAGLPLETIREDPLGFARAHADRKHILVLKDARTVVSDGHAGTYINRSGNHGMAVGGSGDVLTGILCAFAAQGADLLTAARLGVYCHGLAGDEAVKKTGYYGMMAQDLTEALGPVLSPENI